MPDTNATAATPTAPMELNSKLSLLEALQLDLDLDLKLHRGDDPETTPASETTTISERQSSITSPRSSICSSNTSNTSNTSTSDISAHGSTAKPIKRVRFEESVSCSFFEENLEHLGRPSLQKRPSFVQRSWDRIKTRNSSVESDIALASIPATPRNPYTISRRSSSSDLLETAPKRPSLAPKSLSYTIQQPLRESAGRKYDEAQTIAYYRTKPTTTKGDWDDLLGPTKMKTTAV